MKRKFILFLIFFGLAVTIYAQSDSVKADSAKVYRNIESFSKKRRLTKFLYALFFKPVAEKPSSIPQTDISKKKSRTNLAFEGKIIRHIYIKTLDPFGCTIYDTVTAPVKFIYRIGNSLHIRTQAIAIRNLLLIHKNKPFDSLLVKESERLIRAQKYVQEVSFTIRSAGENSDSVDIFIRELDTWSIIPNGTASSTDFTINLEEKNFLGTGHDFQNNYYQNAFNGKYAYKTNYFIPNIQNSYISSTLHYERDQSDNYNKNISVDRPFFSPFAKWAGGIYVGQSFQHGLIKVSDSYLPQDFKINSQDYWAGYAHRIFRGNSENDRTTNLIAEGRFMSTNYAQGPPKIYDTLNLYAYQEFYLARIGISTRKYIQDRYIFNYGRTEDVPIGMVYSVTGGYRLINNAGQLYSGARASFGNYYKWGYLSTNFEYGTFFRSSDFSQEVFSAGFNYFTKLLLIGKLRLRQFIKSQYVIGINRLPYENLNINNGNGIEGFNSASVIGNQKLVVTFQTQSYLPWRILGFRFGPYFIYSFGMLGTEASGFKKSSVYSQIGLGILIRNDFLVFSVFQVSIAFYPVIPGMGDHIIKMNPDKAADFGFRDFDIGKPAAASYQ